MVVFAWLRVSILIMLCWLFQKQAPYKHESVKVFPSLAAGVSSISVSKQDDLVYSISLPLLIRIKFFYTCLLNMFV